MGGHKEAQMNQLAVSGRRLRALVIEVEKTGETVEREGETWEKCIFTLEVTRFSRRTPDEVVPDNLRGKKIKLVRHCLYEWHYRLGVEKTLSPEETNGLLRGKSSSTIFW